MKRTELRRTKGLVRVAMSPRRTPLKRGNTRLGLRRPRTPAERAARHVLACRSGGGCEACVDRHWGTEWHHRLRRTQGGEWSASNGLWLCHKVHAWITEHACSARAKGWGLWQHETPADEPVRYRGVWSLLGDDGSVTPTQPPALDLPDFPIGGAL